MEEYSMEHRTLSPGVQIESNTCYTCTQDTLAFRVSDTQHLTDRTYLSLVYFNRGYLDTAFYLRGLKNVVLDFNGATLLLHGRIQPFILDECENVTIRNVTVAYDRSFYSEFDVVAHEPGALRLRCRKNFPCRVEDGYLIPYAETWENRELHIGDMFVQAFDRETRESDGFTVAAIGEEIRLKDTPPCPVAHLRVREEGGDIVLLGEVPAHWDARHIVALSHETRDKSSAFLCRSKNITVENYRILNGAGYGIVSMYCEDITIDGLILTHDEKSHGILANSADAIHLVATKGDIVIRNSVIEGMFDDALNIHGNFYLAAGLCEGGLRARRTRECYFCDAYYKAFDAGDEICIYRGQTLEPKCRVTLSGVEVIDDYHVWLLTDGDLSSVEDEDIIENLTAQPNLLIENCRCGKAISHLRVQTRGRVVIENNEFGIPLMFTGDTKYWFEASPVTDVLVRGNRFTGERGYISSCPEYQASDAAPYYHSGILVENNVFDTRTALRAHDSADIRFTDNRCIDQEVRLTVHLERCGGTLVLQDCECTGTT